MLRIEYIPDRDTRDYETLERFLFEVPDDVTMEELASVFSRAAVALTFSPDLVREYIHCEIMPMEDK